MNSSLNIYESLYSKNYNNALCFMKQKIANRSLVLLVLIVSVGLYQAWKQDKKPFAFFSEKNTQLRKAMPESAKTAGINFKKDYTYRLYTKDKFHIY